MTTAAARSSSVSIKTATATATAKQQNIYRIILKTGRRYPILAGSDNFFHKSH